MMRCLVDEGMVVYTLRKPLIDKALSSVNERDAETMRCIRRLWPFYRRLLSLMHKQLECESISPSDMQSTEAVHRSKGHSAYR